jgi:hypothetical protein
MKRRFDERSWGDMAESETWKSVRLALEPLDHWSAR